MIAPAPGEPPKSVRLNRFLAECGLGARRKVEELIISGKISVNGKVVSEPGVKIAGEDTVVLEGKRLIRKEKRYFLMNKPRGVICAVTDKRDRTVIDLLEGAMETGGLFPVGRLDKESEGLLILTNDGEVAQKLSHPSCGVIKSYELLLDKPQEEADLLSWKKGAMVEGKWVSPLSVRRIQGKPEKHWIEVRLREGRKRELRVIAANYGFKVLRLIRRSIGNLVIGNLRPGETREITREELVGLTGIGGKQ